MQDSPVSFDAAEVEELSGQHSQAPPPHRSREDGDMCDSTGKSTMCTHPNCENLIRVVYQPETECADDVTALEHARRDIVNAERAYAAGTSALNQTLSEKEKSQTLRVLEKQAEMLYHSIALSKPYASSFPVHFSRPIPFEQEHLWSSTRSDYADLYDAIFKTKADPDTQNALLESYTILRNMFLPDRERKTIESILESDVKEQKESWEHHSRMALSIELHWEKAARDKDRSGKTFTDHEWEQRARDAKMVENHWQSSQDFARLHNMAQRTLQSLSDRPDGGKKVEQASLED